MAVVNPPAFLQAEDYDAVDLRRMLISALTGSQGGIIAAGDLAVSQNGTPNMSVNVATGRAVILGAEATYQGSYVVDNQGSTNVTIAASNPTNPRYDRLVARVRDQEYSGSTNAWDLHVFQGTAAAVPSEPAISGNVLELARITVGAGVTSITTANILDRRVSAPFVTTTWTAPTLLNSWVNYGSPYQVAQYRKVGDVVSLRGVIKDGSITPGAVVFTLPTGFRPPGEMIFAVNGSPTSGTNDHARLDVQADGDVIIGNIGGLTAVPSNAYLSLNGITFSTV